MHQSRNGGQGRLCIGEGRVHLRRPGEVQRVSLESLSQRLEKQGSTTDKLPVEVDHAKEPLQGRTVSRQRKGGDGGHMLVKRRRTRAGDGMAKVLDLGSSKCALLQVDGEAIEAADVKDLAEVKLMRLQGVRKHQNII